MKLYDYYRSSACFRVRIALELKNISYESLSIHLVNNGGEQHHAEYLAVNPQGLVPSLDVNGHLLTQSLAIIEYLDEINPSPPLLPATPLGRAQVRALAYIVSSEIHPLNNLRVLQELRQTYEASEQQIQNWYHLWLKKGFDAIETHLLNLNRKIPVCYGAEVSIADLCLIPQVYNARRFNFPLDKYPLIQDIYEYCMSLQAFVDASPQAVDLKPGL